MIAPPRAHRLALRAYAAALWLLPSSLRRRHGAAMAAQVAAALETTGHVGAFVRVLVLALCDVVRRAAYEAVRAEPDRPSGSGHVVAAMTARAVWRRWVVPFAVVFVTTTTLMLWRYLAVMHSPAPHWMVALLSMPFTAAMTLPMAMFVSMWWTGRALRTELRARRIPGEMWRAVGAAAFGVTALALLLNTQLLPRANAALQNATAGHVVPPSDRSMTLEELRAAAAALAAMPSTMTSATATRDAAEQLANLRVEAHKKFAIAAACLVLAWAGFAAGWRFSRGGALFMTGANAGVVLAYWMALMAGETLADRLVVSPGVGMWGANALVAATVLASTCRPRLGGASRQGA